MPPINKDYYKILHVDPSADPEIIVAVYKRLALKYHPDRNKDPDATLRMQEINTAYHVLHDPVKRTQYDKTRSSRSSESDIRYAEERRKRKEAETAQRRAEEERHKRAEAAASRRQTEGPVGEVSIPVIDVDGAEREVTFTIREINPQALMTRSGKREGKFRDIIRNLAGVGMPEKVMIDLYRYLVLGNFTTYNGQRGKAAQEMLDRAYPDQGVLPGFELQSLPNASGLIVHNVLKHQHSAHLGYQVLGGILVEMLNARFLGKPKLRSG